MKVYIVWHDNGNKAENAPNCGYTEEPAIKPLSEIISNYEKCGCTVFGIDTVNQ